MPETPTLDPEQLLVEVARLTADLERMDLDQISPALAQDLVLLREAIDRCLQPNELQLIPVTVFSDVDLGERRSMTRAVNAFTSCGIHNLAELKKYLSYENAGQYFLQPKEEIIEHFRDKKNQFEAHYQRWLRGQEVSYPKSNFNFGPESYIQLVRALQQMGCIDDKKRWLK